MPQDSKSGREGNEFGHICAAHVAKILGVNLMNQDGANLVTVGGQKGVIKSAHRATSLIGITRSMLPSLDTAFIALEKESNNFEIFQVDKQFLDLKKKPAGSASRENLWMFKVGDIRKNGTKVAGFRLPGLRRYWVTTQWPHRLDKDCNAPRTGVHLPDGREMAGADLNPGDLVAVYEAKNGRTLVRQDITGREDKIGSHVGREGIVALLQITSRLYANNNSKPQHYTDGTKIWWRWRADAEPYLTSGFVSRSELNRILGYAPDNPLRGFGDVHSGLKQVEPEIFKKIEEAFKAGGAVPDMTPALKKPNVRQWGGTGIESPLHKMIKEAIAADPERVLGEAGLKTIKMEFEFPTGDSADVLLEDGMGRVIGLEVEPSVGDRDLPGILQAIKYRHMGALMKNKRFADSRSILVAKDISVLARKICAAYEVECFEIDPKTMRSTRL